MYWSSTWKNCFHFPIKIRTCNNSEEDKFWIKKNKNTDQQKVPIQKSLFPSANSHCNSPLLKNKYDPKGSDLKACWSDHEVVEIHMRKKGIKGKQVLYNLMYYHSFFTYIHIYSTYIHIYLYSFFTIFICSFWNLIRIEYWGISTSRGSSLNLISSWNDKL